MEQRKYTRWTDEEDKRLIQQVMTFPQNLNKCFMIVSEVTGRSVPAVASHWYTVVSKRPEVLCFFTASKSHISRNRKNGVGVQSSPSVWRRLINVVKNLW